VVRGWPHLTLVVARDNWGAPHTGVSCLPVIAIVMAGRCHGPLKALLVPTFAVLDALLAAVGGDVRRCSLIAAQDRLPASLGWTRHDRLVVSGVLGGDVVRCLECFPEEVDMLALVWVPYTVL
jgi:hypothetical protein